MALEAAIRSTVLLLLGGFLYEVWSGVLWFSGLGFHGLGV